MPTPRSIASLPLELIDMIVSEIGPPTTEHAYSLPPETRMTLSACTLVSRSWRAAMLPYLCRRVCLFTAQQHESFLLALVSNDGLESHVEHLAVKDFYGGFLEPALTTFTNILRRICAARKLRSLYVDKRLSAFYDDFPQEPGGSDPWACRTMVKEVRRSLDLLADHTSGEYSLQQIVSPFTELFGGASFDKPDHLNGDWPVHRGLRRLAVRGMTLDEDAAKSVGWRRRMHHLRMLVVKDPLIIGRLMGKDKSELESVLRMARSMHPDAHLVIVVGEWQLKQWKRDWEHLKATPKGLKGCCRITFVNDKNEIDWLQSRGLDGSLWTLGEKGNDEDVYMAS